MKGWSARLAKALLKHATIVLPVNRAEWGRAMLAEAEHLAFRQRVSFALGCICTSYRERLTDTATLLVVGHWSIVIGLCAATAICLRTAYMLRAADVWALILALGLICLAVALAFVRWGFRFLPKAAVAGFAAALLAMLVLGDANAVIGGTMPSGRFYQAILLEQLVGWAVLFGFAHMLMAVQARGGVSG